MNKHLLTEEQKPAVSTLDRPIALLASAGSGKTSVLVQRYLKLLELGFSPKNILTVTFTNEAAEELRDRISRELLSLEKNESLILEVESTPYIGTIHSFCYGVLEQFGSLLSLPGIEKITSPFELSVQFDLAYRHWIENLDPKVLGGLLDHFSHQELKAMADYLFQNHFAISESFENAKPGADYGFKLLKRVYEVFIPFIIQLESRLHAEGQYTFNDLETCALKILRTSETAKLRLQSEIKGLLIDEFQDTSRLQWQILGSLTGNDWKKLFLVGDPKQSIYGFRHADVSLFYEISETIRENGGEVLELSTNFRTHAPLIQDINTLSHSLFEGMEYTPMKSGRNDQGPSLKVQYYATEPDNARSDAQALELSAIVSSIKAEITKGTPPGEMAVLFRNADRIEEYVNALEKEGTPVQAKRTRTLFEHYAVLDLFGYLKCVENPLDDFALTGLLRSSYVGFSYSELWNLNTSGGKDSPLYEKLLKSNPEKLKWFFDLIESGDISVSAALTALFRGTQYFPDFREGIMSVFEPLSLQDLTVNEAVDRIRSWEKQSLFVENRSESVESERGSVQLMTVHAAKGLEFSHVFLADCLRQMPSTSQSVLSHPGETPGIRYRKNDELVYSEGYEKLQAQTREREENEARRILYVALTRAKNTLWVFLPKGMKTIPKSSWAQLILKGLVK